MSKNKKYMISLGVGFFEQRDMDRLSKMAKKGWILKSFEKFGYILEKGEPCDIVYSMDFNLIKEDELDEYIEMFNVSHWKYICSSVKAYHFFSAPKGTKPIYSDRTSFKEKYINLKNVIAKNLKNTLIFIAILLIIRLLIDNFRGDNILINLILNGFIGGLLGFFVICIAMFLLLTKNISKMKN